MKKNGKARHAWYDDLMFKADIPAQHRVLIGEPMTGLVRSEYHFARMCQIIPCNWSSSDSVHWLPHCSPIGYSVADARNCITHNAIERGFEWLLFIDHDVVLPPDAFVRMNEYMLDGKIPVVAGLYYSKSEPPSPLIYRGRGNGHYKNWKVGDKVWVDGIPMGITLINVKLLKRMADDAPWYVAGGNRKVKKVFDTPSGVAVDPEKQAWDTFAGTEDITWCNRVMAGKYLAKAGFKDVGARKYPFLVDTGIFCKHITNDGITYPLHHHIVSAALWERQKKEGGRVVRRVNS